MATITPCPRRESLSVPTIASELDAFLADLAQRRGRSANTCRAYATDLRAVATALPGAVDALTLAEVEAFLFGRDESPATTNRRIASLRAFFRWAQRQAYRADNPLDLVDRKGEDATLPRPIPAGAMKQLEGALARVDQPYRLILWLLRETGMRCDEVLSLNVGDVTLERGREGLRVCEAKTNRDRSVVLMPDVMPKSLQGLRTYVKELGPSAAPTMPLFASNRGTRVSYDALHYQWAQLCTVAKLVDAAGRPRYTPHQLRHTVASELIRHYPEHIVSRMLGHRDPKSTRRYAELTEDQVRAALAQRRSR